MKFVVIGAGALGSIVAAHLARAGTPVALVARGRRADHVEAHGVSLVGLAEFTQAVPVIRPGARNIAADVVIQCVKTYDSASSLASVGFAGRPVALSLQNGVLKNEELGQLFGSGHVLGAAASVAGELLADGTTRFTMNERLPLGEPSGEMSPRARQVAGALADAGIAAEAVDNIRVVEWTKYAGFLPLMAAGILTRQETWRNLSDPGASVAIVRMMREVVALARASGTDVEDKGGLPVAGIVSGSIEDGAARVRRFGASMRERAPQHRVSALQDLLRGGRLEIDAILGHAVRLGQRLGVAIPAIETSHQLATVLSDNTRERS
jgi:2-dehydropantoate 2-reductase